MPETVELVAGKKNQPIGVGFRPAFHALWHLEVLHVVDDLSSFKGDAWDKAEGGATRVAMIDTTVDHRHPNLKGAIDEGLMRDFSARKYGHFTVRTVQGDDEDSRAQLKGQLKNQGSDLAKAILDEIVHPPTEGLTGALADPGTFGAHGTAVAGLIGARPSVVKLLKPAFYRGDSDGGEDAECIWLELPYSGINPTCRIVPICVSAVPRPEMLHAAVDYARMIEPDVVVIADSWDKPPGCEEDSPWGRLESSFRELCKETRVFCAAGNEALSRPVYPASLCTEKQGPWAVGACDAGGDDLSYSPDHEAIIEAGGWMLKTLSTEVSRFDRGGTKTDPYAPKDPDLPSPPPDDYSFPDRDIITTDLPGRAGYNTSPYYYLPGPDDPHYEIASIFCRFAGTSASVAIAGGLASLIPKADAKKFARDGKPCDHLNKIGGLFDFKKAEKLFK